MSSELLPWSEIQMEATRVLQECLPPPPLPPPRVSLEHPYPHRRHLESSPAAADPRPAAASEARRHKALVEERLARIEEVERQHQQDHKALNDRLTRCASLAESAHLASRDGTRALLLAHRRLLLQGQQGRRGQRRLTLDQLRVLVDTGLIFGQEEAGSNGASEDGFPPPPLAGGWAAVTGICDRVDALERENKQLVKQQQHLAALLARTVAALEALAVEEEHGAEEDGEEEEESTDKL